MKELLYKNWQIILTTIIVPLVIWVGTSILDGAELKGYSKGVKEKEIEIELIETQKDTINAKYNKALNKSIVNRIKYDMCCPNTP
tara:strand:- start:185 stop:439 length:255 start_codon:yes stop_codon:yes gene_type:complete